MKLPQNKEAQYNGEIQSADINIGKLIGYEILGNSIFKGRFEGESFNPEKINLNYKLNISKFNFNNYNYNSLDIAGNLNSQTLNSIINIDDSNFRSKNLNLQLSFQNNINTKVEGKLEHVNFKALNFADKNLSLTSRIDAEINGTDIDKMFGQISLNDIKLTNNGELLSLKYIHLNSSQTSENSKVFSLKSNEVEAKIDGKFNFNEIPNSFRFILNKYYPAYITSTSKPEQEQSFKYEIKTKNVEDYLSLFDNKINDDDYYYYHNDNDYDDDYYCYHYCDVDYDDDYNDDDDDYNDYDYDDYYYCYYLFHCY